MNTEFTRSILQSPAQSKIFHSIMTSMTMFNVYRKSKSV